MKPTTQGVSDIVKQQPLVVAGVAFVVGLLLGWFALGWGLFPVDFVNGNVSQLRPDLQQDWVRLTAAEFTLNPDLNRAATRIDALGAAAPQVISDTLGTSTADEKVRILQLKQVLESTGHLKPAGTAATETMLMSVAPVQDEARRQGQRENGEGDDQRSRPCERLE